MATNNTTKVWVRRPNSSPTRIQIPSSISTPVFSPLSATASGDVPRHVDVEATEDFLVDDLREAILRKYPQSLGKHHDTADLSIRIPGTTPMGDGEATRGEGEIGGRLLAPDESVLNVLQTEYPNGQRSHEAWIIITTGGRDNYTRWWLQTGGYLEPGSMRSALSPNPFSAGGWFGGAEPGHQEYFPYIPQTVVTPPGEYPARSRASVGSSVQYPRSQQGRPPLIPGRGTSQNSIYPGRRYDSTNTSSMVVEPLSQTESEIGRAQGRRSPDSNIVLNPRYPPNIRPSSSISARNNTTPPGDYPPNRVRQYPPGAKVPTTVPNQAFQMQLPPTQIVSQKVPSPSSGVPPNPNPQRLSTSSSVRPKIPIPNASPSTATENPNQQSQQQQPSAALKASTGSPKSSVSGPASGNAGGPSGMASTTSPTTRRRGNTASGQKPPALTGPRDPSSVVERIESPRAPRGVPLVKSKADKESSLAPPAPPKGSVLGLIPPINVLIVEDNIINAQILEAFFRKRKLKYATAVNGKQAVEKWRQGGWHLVLMDIQLPVMSGIEATKEIRRLERVNHIGVFHEEPTDKPSPEDELGDLPFPSPVIIVALTASSRATDRNEALAAGCNDFLTKPVGAPWLERKAIEWGCMQALIWTAFERKKRKETERENGVVVEEEAAGQEEKPAVTREDSGETVSTKDSIERSTEEALAGST